MGKNVHAADANRQVLVVVDVQNDFVTGSLGNPQAEAVVAAIVEHARDFDGTVVLTQDTHDDGYLATNEGRNLPVEHCLRGTWGWELVDDLRALAEARGWKSYEKPTFGSTELARDLVALNEREPIGSVELIGFCTDICVVSNALLIKAHLPETNVKVTPELCAGVTPRSHDAALQTMRSCQIAC